MQRDHVAALLACAVAKPMSLGDPQRPAFMYGADCVTFARLINQKLVGNVVTGERAFDVV